MPGRAPPHAIRAAHKEDHVISRGACAYSRTPTRFTSTVCTAENEWHSRRVEGLFTVYTVWGFRIHAGPPLPFPPPTYTCPVTFGEILERDGGRPYQEIAGKESE